MRHICVLTHEFHMCISLFYIGIIPILRRSVEQRTPFMVARITECIIDSIGVGPQNTGQTVCYHIIAFYLLFQFPMLNDILYILHPFFTMF